jgi:hypothetical protein
MRASKGIVIAGFVTFELLTSHALANPFSKILKPLQMPIPRASDCTNSGFGQVCKRIVPPAVLTDDQVRTIQEWHNQNIEALKKQSPN